MLLLSQSWSHELEERVLMLFAVVLCVVVVVAMNCAGWITLYMTQRRAYEWVFEF
jgi:energy-coupling factor transporter transmembrane protein EcfT